MKPQSKYLDLNESYHRHSRSAEKSIDPKLFCLKKKILYAFGQNATGYLLWLGVFCCESKAAAFSKIYNLGKFGYLKSQL
jgi:hypothetical protein